MRYYSSTATVMALTASYNEAVTTIVVNTVLGLPAQTPFTLVLDVGLSTEEIVTVTEVSGTSLTVTRGQDGSTAVAHSIGAVVRHMMTARDLRDPATHVDAASDVHGIGATASVVGTDTAQTLTNKTVNFADNVIIGVPQASVVDLVDDIAALASEDVALAVDIVNATNPAGTVLLWAGNATAPSGYLLADGTAKSRTTYSDLFAVVGTAFGAGDGTTTFNLPAMNGRVPVGFDATQTQFDAMGETGGEKTHVLSTAEMPAHTHGRSSDVPVGSQFSYFIGSGGSTLGVGTGTNAASAPTTGSTGGGDAHNNLQPYIVLRYIVKF